MFCETNLFKHRAQLLQRVASTFTICPLSNFLFVFSVPCARQNQTPRGRRGRTECRARRPVGKVQTRGPRGALPGRRIGRGGRLLRATAAGGGRRCRGPQNEGHRGECRQREPRHGHLQCSGRRQRDGDGGAAVQCLPGRCRAGAGQIDAVERPQGASQGHRRKGC